MKRLLSVKPLIYGLALTAAGLIGSDVDAPYKEGHTKPKAVAIADSVPQPVLERPFGFAHDTLEKKLNEELQATLVSASAVKGIARVEDIYGPGVREGLNDYAPHLSVITGAFEVYGLPGELAIKPFIESNGDVDAISSAKARGFSQLSPDKDNSLRDYLASKGVSYQYKDWLTQLSASAACDLFNVKAAGNSFSASQIAYNAGEGNLMRVLRDGRKAVERRFGDIELPTAAYASIGQLLTSEIAKKTHIGSFKTDSREYPLKFAAFIPELRETLSSTEQEPIFRYIIDDSTLVDNIEARTGLTKEQVVALNKHKLGYHALFNSPVPLNVKGLDVARQLRDIRPEELAVTQRVIDYDSRVAVPDSSKVDEVKAYNNWRKAIAAEYERVAIDPQTGRPSMYSLLGAWGANNCGAMSVPGVRTAKYEKNHRVIAAFNSVFRKHSSEIDTVVGHYTGGRLFYNHNKR